MFFRTNCPSQRSRYYDTYVSSCDFFPLSVSLSFNLYSPSPLSPFLNLSPSLSPSFHPSLPLSLPPSPPPPLSLSLSRSALSSHGMMPFQKEYSALKVPVCEVVNYQRISFLVYILNVHVPLQLYLHSAESWVAMFQGSVSKTDTPVFFHYNEVHWFKPSNMLLQEYMYLKPVALFVSS